MKNVIITVLTILILTLGGYLVYDKFMDNGEELNENNEIREEQYTLLDKNSDLVQFLYNGSKGVSAYSDSIYTTKYLSASNRSYEDKLCLIMDQVKQSTNGYSENKIKELYEKVNGVNSYNRLDKVSCPCSEFNFDAVKNEYYVVEDGCGGLASYQSNINEVRKYNDRIEIITTYYYSGFVSNTGLNDWKVCTDQNCNTILVESIDSLEIDVFVNYKDKLNKLIYTYKLDSNNNNYYYHSTEIIPGEVLNNSIQLKNYNVDLIKNIEVRVPVKNSTDPEMKNVIITDKDQIKSILINVDNVKEVGKVPEGIGFTFNVVITVNYDGDPSSNIIILDNGNIAINKAVGVGETSYVEYEISNKNLATELINKYQK